MMGWNSIFGHVARLPDNTPAHQAILQVELAASKLVDPTWKRQLNQMDCVPSGPIGFAVTA